MFIEWSQAHGSRLCPQILYSYCESFGKSGWLHCISETSFLWQKLETPDYVLLLSVCPVKLCLPYPICAYVFMYVTLYIGDISSAMYAVNGIDRLRLSHVRRRAGMEFISCVFRPFSNRGRVEADNGNCWCYIYTTAWGGWNF